jgi:hypothetical protein
LNLRLFQEGSYEYESESENKKNYTIIIHLKDGWKIYPIPYPKYDSNKGFRLGMEFYYFNIGGSLLNFFIEGAVDLKIEEGVLRAGDWKINPSMNNLKIGKIIFSAEIYQSFSNNQKIENLIPIENYDVYQTDLIFTSRIGITKWENFFYEMKPEFDFSYGFKDYLSTAQYTPFRFNWNHSFGYDHINWIGFDRTGFFGEFSNTLGLSSINDQIEPSLKISLEGQFFYLMKRFNPSIRVYAMKSWNDEIENLGENIRGLLDAYMFGKEAFFINLGFEFPIIDVKNKFEIHLLPFIDMGTVFKNDFTVATGADLILYADRFSSLQFRFSFGTDLNSLFTSDPDMYEIEISSSLAY